MKYYLLFIMLFAFANQTFAQEQTIPRSEPFGMKKSDENINIEPVPLNMQEVKRRIGYPPVAKEAGIEGQVIIRILVDEQGNYIRHIIAKAGHPILQMAIEEHIKELRFTPAIQNGKPTKFWVNLPLNFKLEGEIKKIKKKKRWWRK